MRLMEFFIKGPLQETTDVLDIAFMADASTDFKKTQLNLNRDEEKLSRRKKLAPWISRTQWIALDKLSLIAPFNTPNENNKCKNLSDHIEKNPEMWLHWLQGMVKNDYTMKDKEFIDDSIPKDTLTDKSN